MSIDFLISVLNNVDTPKKINRNNAAIIVLEHPKLIKHLVTITFDVDNKLCVKAAWILEWICTHYDIVYLSPYIDFFTENLKNLKNDSVLRCCAKICENLATAYSSKENNTAKKWILNKNIDTIIEIGFDWLITDQKIAVKAYSMTFLYVFGIEKDWVHPELKHIISSNVIHESKGCEARGRKILKLMK
ncbi:adenylosuccinate lyase [Tenacibaculum sp. M341]|uniref:adenylosuccinate lyase n=1 Tax=Tenacibaculum sp. M341 TaxID=2530339 RepID=UPI00104F1A51|nr:adenylosuccinate lyase [Tenacibaculum sp. M341]TCI94893.1 adenylosuccinate lyase [Tenacibaculum sp. M341]